MPDMDYKAWAIELCSLLDAVENAVTDGDSSRVATLLAGRLDIAKKHGVHVTILGHERLGTVERH